VSPRFLEPERASGNNPCTTCRCTCPLHCCTSRSRGPHDSRPAYPTLCCPTLCRPCLASRTSSTAASRPILPLYTPAARTPTPSTACPPKPTRNTTLATSTTATTIITTAAPRTSTSSWASWISSTSTRGGETCPALCLGSPMPSRKVRSMVRYSALLCSALCCSAPAPISAPPPVFALFLFLLPSSPATIPPLPSFYLHDLYLLSDLHRLHL
jgi:hypothetical protein